MSVNISKSVAVSTSTVQTAAGKSAEAGRASQAASKPLVNKVTGEPEPVRFPWLSRVTHQLQQASKIRPPYQAAPLIGENVDKSA